MLRFDSMNYINNEIVIYGHSAWRGFVRRIGECCFRHSGRACSSRTQ
jgi:hypothetical protein